MPKKIIEIDLPDFLPRISAPLISVPVDADQETFEAVASFPFNVARYPGYEQVHLTFAVTLGAAIQIRVMHGPNVMALADGIETSGIFTIPMTMPEASGLLELQIKKSGAGDNPTLHSCIMELDE